MGLEIGTLMAIGAATSAVGTAYSIYSGQQAAAQQKEALAQQERAQAQQMEVAKKQQATAEENINRANAKSPDTASILSSAQQAAAGGSAGTMLTGPQGIVPNQLALGKNTLLGA